MKVLGNLSFRCRDRRGPKGAGRCILWYVKRLRKYSVFVIINSYFKDSLQSSQLGIQKEVHFLSKMVFKMVRGRGWTSG